MFGCSGEISGNNESHIKDYTVTPIGAPINTPGGGTITAFKFSSAAIERRFDVYLPPGYNNSKNQRYPVLYMHDGQNLFFPERCFIWEWNLDDNIEYLIEQGKIQKIIAVGIDNAETDRLTEFVTDQAKSYTKLLMSIKNHIDKTYRTLPDREYTGLMGASAGAATTLYAAHHHPETFGLLGIYSIYAPYSDIYGMIKNNEHARFHKVYIAAGAGEVYNLN